MKKYLFIVNPVAGNGKTQQLIPTIKNYFDKLNGIEYRIIVTQRVGHAELLAKEGVEKGYNNIISVGGDGTAYEIINGIGLNSNVCLGLIPSGTGNDFVRMLDIDTTNIYELLDVIIEGEYLETDIGYVNGRFFINYCSTGFDTLVVEESRKIKKYISGPPAYLIGLFKALKKHVGSKVKITVDGIEYNKKVDFIAVNNGKYYGGGMMINPNALIDDGLFDICLVNSIPKIKYVFLFYTVFKGEHINLDCVETFRGRDIRIETEERWIINADGDFVGSAPADINMNKVKLKVLNKVKEQKLSKIIENII